MRRLAILAGALFAAVAPAQDPVCSSLEVERFLAAPQGSSTSFGSAIAVDPGVAIFADQDDGAVALGAGAAYVFRRVGGAWVQEQKLVASDGASGDEFGRAVDIDGAVAVASRSASDCVGGVYVFRFDGATWSEEAKLVSTSVSFCANFGSSVAVDGDVLLVGADRDDLVFGTDAGAVVVYRFDGAAWNEEQVLAPPALTFNPEFGSRVALAGDVAAVAMPSFSFGQGLSSGSVHLFRYDGAAWQATQVVTPSDSAADDYFGRAIALDGARLAVGAGYYDGGRVYVYDDDGAQWTNERQLAAGDASTSGFASGYGLHVALGNGRVAVAADSEGQQPYPFLGAVYLYEPAGTSWTETKLLSSVASFSDHVGSGGVAFTGDELFVGAPEHDSQVAPFGADWGTVFRYDPTTLAACPRTYCTPKLSSSGCSPSASWWGVPSDTTGFFFVEAAAVEAQRNGLLFYGYAANAVPFLGGTLCVGTPLFRTSVTNSGGFAACAGLLRNPFHLAIQSGADPFLAPGIDVFAQFWFRDPPSSFGAGLSNAVTFTVEP